jgi:hypothetical protein
LRDAIAYIPGRWRRVRPGTTVAANIRLDAVLVWKLVHELPRALKEQTTMEEVVARRQAARA